MQDSDQFLPYDGKNGLTATVMMTTLHGGGSDSWHGPKCTLPFHRPSMLVPRTATIWRSTSCQMLMTHGVGKQVKPATYVPADVGE